MTAVLTTNDTCSALSLHRLPRHCPPIRATVGEWKTVEFLGQGFTSSTTVSFNGTAATRTVKSGTYLIAVVPDGATTGFVTVTNSGGRLTSNKKFRVTPQVTSFGPPGGPVGTVVTITGVSLRQATKVTFGGIQAATFTVNSDAQVIAAVPTGALTREDRAHYSRWNCYECRRIYGYAVIS